MEPMDSEDILPPPRYYFYLEQLQKMAQELPAKYRVRIDDEFLSTLAFSLLNEDRDIFKLVEGLRDKQYGTIQHLTKQKVEWVNSITEYIIGVMRKDTFGKKYKHLPKHQIEQKAKEFIRKQKKSVELLTNGVNLSLYREVTDQQITLGYFKIPGFFVTQDDFNLEVQKYLVDFILRLGKMKVRY